MENKRECGCVDMSIVDVNGQCHATGVGAGVLGHIQQTVHDKSTISMEIDVVLRNHYSKALQQQF